MALRRAGPPRLARARESRPHVVIGFADALSAPEVAWSLLRAGYEVTAFSRRGRRPSLRRCSAVRLHPVSDPVEDCDGAVAELSALLAVAEPAALMPLDDAAVWMCAQADRPPVTGLVGPEGSRASLAIDKRIQIAAAARAGFAVPETRICTSPEEIVGDPVEFPVMVKPALALTRRANKLISGSRCACANGPELERALATAAADVPFIVQPYIAGVGEGIFGLAREGELLRWSGHRRVRMMSPHGSGSSACVSTPVDAGLRTAAAAMIGEIGWNGLFMIELLRDVEGKAWFVELNGRAWGSMALARRMGYEYPAWAVSAHLDHDFTAPEPPAGAPVVCRHLGRELVHLMIVMRGSPSTALVLWPSRGRTLRDLLRISRRDRWYNLQPGTVGLFIEDALQTVSRALRDASP